MPSDDIDDIFGDNPSPTPANIPPATPVPPRPDTSRPASPFGQTDISDDDDLFGFSAPQQPTPEPLQEPLQEPMQEPMQEPGPPDGSNTSDDDLFAGLPPTQTGTGQDTGQGSGTDEDPRSGRRFGRKKGRTPKSADVPSDVPSGVAVDEPSEEFTPPAPEEFEPVMQQPVAPVFPQPAEPFHQPVPESSHQSDAALFGFTQPARDVDDDDSDGGSSAILRKVVPAVAGVALLIGACVGVWNILPDEKTPEPAATSAVPVADPTSISVKQWDGDGPATFAPVALNSMPIPDTSVVAPTEHGLVVINDKKLAVYEAGQRISAVMSVPEAVKFVLPTQINGVDFLVWRAGNVLYFWSPDAPTVAPVKQRIGETATVSSAGRSILIQMGSDTFVTDTKNFTKVTSPTRASAAVPMSFDGTTITAGDPNGALWLIGLDGEAESLELEPPAIGAKPAKWVTSGHGLAVSLWRKSGDPRVLVAVHSTKDGTLMSATPADQSAVSGQQWIRGQDFKKAAFGPLEFDMETGELVFDGTKSGVQFTRPFGDTAPGVSAEGDVIVAESKAGHTAWAGGTPVIGVDGEGNAIVRSDDKTTLSFHAPNG